MRMRAFKSHGMNRVIARGVSHTVNDISRRQSYNERLKREVYSYGTDDNDFYETYSKYPKSEIKNRYILQRLREIEMRRNGTTADTPWIGIFAFIMLFVVVLFFKAISNL